MTPTDKAGVTPRHSAVMTDVGYAALEESNAQLKLALQEARAEVGRVKAKKEKLGKWYIEECAESQREFNRASTAEQQLATEQQAVRALDALYQSALQQLEAARAELNAQWKVVMESSIAGAVALVWAETREECERVCDEEIAFLGSHPQMSSERGALVVVRDKIHSLPPLQAHSNSEYKRLVAQGADVAPPRKEEDNSGPRQDFERGIYKANPPGDTPEKEGGG